MFWYSEGCCKGKPYRLLWSCDILHSATGVPRATCRRASFNPAPFPWVWNRRTTRTLKLTLILSRARSLGLAPAHHPNPDPGPNSIPDPYLRSGTAEPREP